jgi:hypothetical protein
MNETTIKYLIKEYQITEEQSDIFDDFISEYCNELNVKDNIDKYWKDFAEIEYNHGLGSLAEFLNRFDLNDLKCFDLYFLGAFDDEEEFTEIYNEENDCELSWEEIEEEKNLYFTNGYVFVRKD